MAVLTITPGSVFAQDNVEREIVTAGETITAGQLVYLQTSTGYYFKSRAHTPPTAAIDGIALTGSSAGQPLIIGKVNSYQPGNIDLGATLVIAMPYVLASSVAGGIQPVTDIGTGDYVVVFGVAKQTNNLVIGVIDPDAQSASDI